MDDVRKRLVQLAEGVYVERDTLNIAQKIMEYDSNLRLKFCNPDLAEFGDAPYKVMEICRDGIERVVMEVWELDDRVLERLRAADTLKNDILGNIDAAAALVRNDQNRRFKEEVAEANDMVTHYLKSMKSTYSIDLPHAKVTIDSQEGRKAKVEYK